jgi:glycosyltransferase involved in cell wall biosynthesis
LLVISYHLPSDGEVGGLRWAGLTKYLSELGWRSWILTAAPLPAGELPLGVTVESCPRGRTLTDAYRRLRQAAPLIVLPPRRAELPARGGLAAVLRPLAALRVEAAGLLALLHDGHGWIVRGALRARALIASVRPDVVVTTGPPHPTHLIGWLATRGRGVRWIVDFRDPWAGPVGKAWQAEPGSVLARALIAAAERLVLRSASEVFTTTRELGAALAAQYPRAAITWVPNAADPDLLPPISQHPFPGLAVAHVGTLYGGRDLGPVLRALRVLLDRHPEVARDSTKLRHAGQVEARQAEAIKRDVAELSLGNYVELRGVLPRADALGLLARSRVAIVLAQDQDCQIPAKLYECVALGIPTLVVAPLESATGREAVRLGASLAAPDDVEGIARLLWIVCSNPNHRPSAPRPRPPASDYRTVASVVAAQLAPRR